jgi:hypothetical protein
MCTDQKGLLKNVTGKCTGYEKESGFGWSDVNHFLTKTSGGVTVLIIFILVVLMIAGVLIGCIIKKWGCGIKRSEEPVKYVRVPTEESDGEDAKEDDKEDTRRVRGFDIDEDDDFLNP